LSYTSSSCVFVSLCSTPFARTQMQTTIGRLFLLLPAFAVKQLFKSRRRPLPHGRQDVGVSILRRMLMICSSLNLVLRFQN
jgi:hypothetical protein